MSQQTLADEGELAPLLTFQRTANRAKSIGIIRRAPWESDRYRSMSRLGRYIAFCEEFVILPVVRRPMVLHPYQREMFERFLDPATRQDMEKIPRGNAKTTSVGGFIVAAAFLEDDHDVPIVATTVKQAEKTTYGAVLEMTTGPSAHAELKERVQKFTSVADKRLVVPQTNSVVYPMADLAAGLQGLNPSVGVLDEASEAAVDTFDALSLAAGKRPESITIGISTPSFKLEGNAMLEFEQSIASGVELPGVVFHEHRAPDGCDHRDERNWFTANPGLLTTPPILSIDALRADVGRTAEQRFRCYRLAQWPTMLLEGWLGESGAELWDALADPWTFRPKAPTWVGVDVSLRHDSTAVVAVQDRGDGRHHAVARIWYPGRGQVIDRGAVREHIAQLHRNFDVKGVAYDPRFFEDSAQELHHQGVAMIEVPQTAARMVPAVTAGYSAIVGGRLSHDDDEVFAAHIVNAQARPSEGGITISKNPKAPTLKIDACIAFCLAMSIASAQSTEFTDDAWKVL